MPALRIHDTTLSRLYIERGCDEVVLRKSCYPARHGREDAIILARDLTLDR